MSDHSKPEETNLPQLKPSAIEELILHSIQEIQAVVLGLDTQFTEVGGKLQQAGAKLDLADQKLSTIEKQVIEFDDSFQQMKHSLSDMSEKLTGYDKRFQFIAKRFNALAQQMDHLDTEFSSLKTLVLSAVDKAMKEYSNFVVEKLSLGNTIDVLRLEVDKLKTRIEKLEQID